jgi:hypothetical protein
MIKKFIFLATFTFSFTCMVPRKVFSQSHFKCVRDEQIKQKYDFLKNEFQLLTGSTIENILFYKGLRFIDQKSLYAGIKAQIKLEDIYYPAPKTWNFWSEGELKVQQLVNKKLLNKLPLTLEDLQSLHKVIVDTQLMGPITHFVSKIISPEENNLLHPGRIRDSIFI